MDESGKHYFLIGVIAALSHLYEINRAIAVNKEVHSLIYTANKDDVLPDLDRIFPIKL